MLVVVVVVAVRIRIAVMMRRRTRPAQILRHAGIVRDVKGRCAVSSVASADNVQLLIVQIVNAILTGIGSRGARHGHTAARAVTVNAATEDGKVMRVVVSVVMAVMADVMMSVQTRTAYTYTSATRRMMVMMLVR